MTQAAPSGQDRLGAWCGWVLTAGAVLTPLLAWLGPLGFAPLVALIGLLCLPAVRIREPDGAVALVLLLGIGWAALTSLWSPMRPSSLEDSVVLKLAAQLVLYWAAYQGALRAAPAGQKRAARLLAWGLALYGALLVVDSLLGGGLYLGLRTAIGDPIRPDLGAKNIAQGTFVLALLWPVAAVAGWRAGAPPWLAAPMVLGVAFAGHAFKADAPVMALGFAVAAAGLLWAAPRAGPRILAAGAAVLVLLMPLVVLAIRPLDLGARVELSWGERVAYWNYAVDRIAEHPVRGWGLDASRTFSPHIVLHPHNGAIQVWLELGALGAVAAALVWGLSFLRLQRETRSLAAAATAGSMVVYLLLACVSFGVWQEWWLGLAALTAMVGALAAAVERTSPVAMRRAAPSTKRGFVSKTPDPPARPAPTGPMQ